MGFSYDTEYLPTASHAQSFLVMAELVRAPHRRHRHETGTTSMEVLDGLVDAIYEASVVPEQWRGVLDQLATVSECKGEREANRKVFQHGVDIDALSDENDASDFRHRIDKSTSHEIQ
jgi:hypothetical protein